MIDVKDRTGEVWVVWSGLMLIVGPPEHWDELGVTHPCFSLESGRRFSYMEFREGGFEESLTCTRLA